MLAVLAGGVRDGRIYYVDTGAASVDFDGAPGRGPERYVRSAPEEAASTALGAAVVFRLAAVPERGTEGSPCANATEVSSRVGGTAPRQYSRSTLSSPVISCHAGAEGKAAWRASRLLVEILR